MASSLNKVILIGNLGRDPEIRQTNEGRKIANLTIATSDKWTNKITGDVKEKTEWHRIVVFNENLVKIIEDYVKKGNKVYLEGSLQTRKWQDATGQEKYTTEIILQNFNSQIILLDSKSGTVGTGIDNNNFENLKSNRNVNFDSSEFDDEIPF